MPRGESSGLIGLAFVIVDTMLKRAQRLLTRNNSQSGLTMIELLVVIAILAVLMVILLFMYQIQLARSRDARRKADLEKIKIAFEEYYNDNGCYPPGTILDNCRGSELQPYLNEIPCDPFNGEPYLYVPVSGNTCAGYRLLTILEDGNDPDIEQVGCSGPTLCGFGDYNWGVSAGVPIGAGLGGSGSQQGPGFACDPQGICNSYSDPDAAGCPLSFSSSNCDNRCSNPVLWCDQ